MRLSNGGDLLRDQILRGISEESFCNLSISVYGKEEFEADFNRLKTTQPKLVPCEGCSRFEECLGNLKGDQQKRLIAELTVCRYRQIAQDCGAKAILAVDFLLLVMEKINYFCEEFHLEFPIRQAIYKIAKLIAKNLGTQLEIRGKMNLKPREITSTFDQEIRKYEQMGLIAYSREIRKLPSESGPSRNVFRFDRHFQISEFGQDRLNKVRNMRGIVAEYDGYLQAWNRVEEEIEQHKDEVIEILRTHRHVSNTAMPVNVS